jgi:hypothetical protein
VGTINMLMYLFNVREDEIFKLYDDNGNGKHVNGKPVYQKNYFCCAEAIIDVFDVSKKGSLHAFSKNSKVLFPYRTPVLDNKYIINLVIMIPGQQKLFLLDLFRSRDDSRILMDIVKKQFDRYYSSTFTIELYSTIPEINGVIDTFERMELISNDLPIIYMYVAIYYVLFGCPLIFYASDINNKYFRDRIKYEILTKTLFL